jgi:hypothetical protein
VDLAVEGNDRGSKSKDWAAAPVVYGLTQA